MAAVAAARSAARDELLAAEAEAAAAAVAGCHLDVDFVDEHQEAWRESERRSAGRPSTRAAVCQSTPSSGQDADEAAARAVILEPHAAGDLGEQRVVFAEADVEARPEPAAALAHENRRRR